MPDFVRFGARRGRLFGAVRGVMWCLLAMEIPPAGAPPGGGVRLCGNVLWVHMIFGEWCRFAQDDTVGRMERST